MIYKSFFCRPQGLSNIDLTCIAYIGALFAEEQSDDCKKCDNSNVRLKSLLGN
jgi:hypothetical protein